MLVLSRRQNEKVVLSLESLIAMVESDPAKLKQILSQPIEVVVCDVRDEKARLGFTAAVEIAVNRQEVWESIKRGNTCMSKRW